MWIARAVFPISPGTRPYQARAFGDVQVFPGYSLLACPLALWIAFGFDNAPIGKMTTTTDSTARIYA